MRYVLRSLLLVSVLLAVSACGEDAPSSGKKAYREQERDPATLSDFAALYHLEAGTVAGKEVKANPFNYDLKGLAELTYTAATRTAVLRLAACVEVECDQPGGSIAVTSPTLLLTKLSDREIWFQTAPGALTTVTLWGAGLQTDGRPFALATTSDGKVPFDLSAIQFPYE